MCVACFINVCMERKMIELETRIVEDMYKLYMFIH